MAGQQLCVSIEGSEVHVTEPDRVIGVIESGAFVAIDAAVPEAEMFAQWWADHRAPLNG